MKASVSIAGSVVGICVAAGLVSSSAHSAPSSPPGGIIPPGGPGGPGSPTGPGGIGNISAFDFPLFEEGGGGPPAIFDFGDAPDDRPLCGNFGGFASFPTVRDSGNAVGGRNAPIHGPVSLLNAVVLGRFISYELGAVQPGCDWLTPGCDSFGDDGALILCFDGSCNSGITLGNGACGQSGFGAYFGPRPSANAQGFWVASTSRGANSAATAYLNIVTDVDQSGVFDDQPTGWCLRDADIEVIAPNVQIFRSSSFPVGNVIYTLPNGQWAVDAFWNRMTVAPEKLGDTFFDAWDGSGPQAGYESGETEDWIVKSVDNEYQCRLPLHAFESAMSFTISLNPGAPGCSGGVSTQAVSADQPIGMMREFRTSAYRTGRTVPLEMSQLTLAGFSAALGGDFVVRERADRLSFGVIDEVNAGGGVFSDGKVRFDLWIEIELLGSGVVVNTGSTPIRLDGGAITQIPPLGTSFQIPSTYPSVRLFDKSTGQPAGWLCISDYHMSSTVPAVCPGDANGDRKVDFSDISAVLTAWGSGGPTGDPTGDCKVDFIDISSVLVNWAGACR